MRKALIAGNWKMNMTVPQSVGLTCEIKDMLSGVSDVEIVVAPPFLAIHSVAQELKGANIHLSAQDVFWEEKGAYTGAISPPMLLDAGCKYVIVGHSERRQYFGETDDTVNKKMKAALHHGLLPIFCVGEVISQRESGETFNVIETQVQGGLSGLSPLEMKDVTIAYEPVWAIGTGKTATGEQAEEMHDFIRGLVRKLYKDTADNTRVLYGGSVKPDNINGLMTKPNIDGVLVGGASLKAQDFAKIVRYQR